MTPPLEPSALVRALSEQLTEAQAEIARLREALQRAIDEAEAVSCQVVCIGMMSDDELEIAATSWAELPDRIRSAALRQTEET